MGKIQNLLTERLKKKDKSNKMEKMSKQSASGNLTSFSGVFNIAELSSHEKDALQNILLEYSRETESISTDLNTLISITSEVKAITNQAILLHGERIKKAQTILKNYQEGAFTAWLITTYGNRQTPYNFLQYFEFFNAIPQTLRPQLEKMPRQAIYTLASREGELTKKQQLIENYSGETKSELLTIIRDLFPLSEDDKRRQNFGETTITTLKRLSTTLTKRTGKLNKKQKGEIAELLDNIYEMLKT
ncbi:MAG: CT583 family protein [Chlamydiota bacterium]|nr:CT583 family protein [Chlamydiota bacterium]